MSRRKKSSDGAVSLFPFISILTCLIGILTLLIALTMVIKKRKSSLDEEELARANANQELKEQASEASKKIAEIKAKIFDKREALVKFNGIKEQLDLLRGKQAALSQTDVELIAKINKLQEQTRSIEQTFSDIEGKRMSLSAEIEERKNLTELKESVIIDMGGTGLDRPRHMYFVECDHEGIVIRAEDGDTIRVGTHEINTSKAYADFCSRVQSMERKESPNFERQWRAKMKKERKIVEENKRLNRLRPAGQQKHIEDAELYTKPRTTLVIYLIRNTNTSSYHLAAGLAEVDYGLNTGKLAIPNDGPIDLSKFGH